MMLNWTLICKGLQSVKMDLNEILQNCLYLLCSGSFSGLDAERLLKVKTAIEDYLRGQDAKTVE